MPVSKHQIMRILESYRSPKAEDVTLAYLCDGTFDGKEEVEYIADHIVKELNEDENPTRRQGQTEQKDS